MTGDKSPRADRYGKAERALALHEKGVDHPAIAQRLGTTVRSINTMICVAKARRAKAEVRE